MPRECLRLQGCDEEQIDKILAITSDAQAYKQAGNSVTVNVIEAIGHRLREWMRHSPRGRGMIGMKDQCFGVEVEFTGITREKPPKFWRNTLGPHLVTKAVPMILGLSRTQRVRSGS